MQRASQDDAVGIPLLAVLDSRGVWQRLDWGHLIVGFDLTARNPAIDFVVPDEERAVWIDVEQDHVVQRQAMQLPLALGLRETCHSWCPRALTSLTRTAAPSAVTCLFRQARWTVKRCFWPGSLMP